MAPTAAGGKDEDDKVKKNTIESLFLNYCNFTVYAMAFDNKKHEAILLSQIDYWLDQAKLLKTVFPMTETGLAYMKFRKWRLDFEEFLEFLQMICEGKDIKVDDLKEILVSVGVPKITEVMVK